MSPAAVFVKFSSFGIISHKLKSLQIPEAEHISIAMNNLTFLKQLYLYFAYLFHLETHNVAGTEVVNPYFSRDQPLHTV